MPSGHRQQQHRQVGRRRRKSECRNQGELDALRKSRRDEKRRQRARLFARGLSSTGKPLTPHALATHAARQIAKTLDEWLEAQGRDGDGVG